MDRLKDLVRQAKSIAYSDIENKVREATSNEPWGPSSTLLSELAQATNFQNEVYTEMVTMLWKRLLHEGQPRHTLKALMVIEYLLKRGHERFIELCRRNIATIADLARYRFIDDKGEDKGDPIRKKASTVVELLRDTQQLEALRDEAERLAREDKFRGFSNDSYDPRYQRSDPTSFSSATAAASEFNRRGSGTSLPPASYDADPFDDAPASKPRASAAAAADDDPFGSDEWSKPASGAPRKSQSSADPFADPFAAPAAPAAPAVSAAPKPAAQQSALAPTLDPFGSLPASHAAPAPVAAAAAAAAPISVPAPASATGDRRRQTATSQGAQAAAAKQATTLAGLNNDLLSSLTFDSATTSSTPAASSSSGPAFDIFGGSGTAPAAAAAAAAPKATTDFDALFDAAQKPQTQQPGFGQPAFGQPAFGQPGFGQPAFGQPAGFGQPGFGQMPFGQPNPMMMQQQMMMQNQQPFGGFGLPAQPAPGFAQPQQPDVFAAALFSSPTSTTSGSSSAAASSTRSAAPPPRGNDAFASLEQFVTK